MAKCLSQPESFHRGYGPNKQSPLSTGSKLGKFVVPANESSLYWSVTLAYLIPVKDDKVNFDVRFKSLFGREEIIISNLESVRTTIQNYNPLSDVIPDDKKLRDLIRETFHDRVCNYMLDKRFDIIAICEMLNSSINVAGANECQYGGMGTQMQLFHVDLSTAGGARNHYNFSLNDNIIDGYQRSLVDDTLKKLEIYSNYYSTDDVEDKDGAKTLQTSEVTFDSKTIEDIAKIKWYGSKVIYKIISANKLECMLKGYLEELKKLESIEKFLVVMIELKNIYWVPLVVHYNDNKFSGYYFDSTGQLLPDTINNTWRQIDNIDIVDIVDFTINGKKRSDQYNSGLFAIENASRIIENITIGKISNKISMSKKLLQTFKTTHTDIAIKLSKKRSMEDKIIVCSKILSKMKAIALDDASLMGQNYLNEFRSQIIGSENSALAHEIRNSLFLHRKHTQKVIESNIGYEMRKILKNKKITCEEFFKNLSGYMSNVNTKLKGDKKQTLIENIFEPKDLLISKEECSSISFGNDLSDNESLEELSKLFKEIIKQIGSTPDDKGGDSIMFNFIVNIIPILGPLYSKPKSESRNALEPKGLEKIREFRNAFFHNFHAHGDTNKERFFLLKQGLHDLLDYFFKYYFIRMVCKEINKDSTQTLRQDISDLLENTQSDFKNNYYISEPAVEMGSELSNFICDYIKLMSVIDNKVVNKERETNFKQSKNQVLYRKLKAIDRKRIYNSFKELRKSHTSTECFDAKAFGKKIRIEYDILIKPIYIEQMFEYYVKNKNQCSQFEDTEIVDIVNNDIRALKRITRYHHISNKKIIKLYGMFINGEDVSDMLGEFPKNEQISIQTKLGSLQSKKRKLSNLSTYFEIKDEKDSRIKVVVDVVETIKNILEMLDDHIEYPFLSLDINDIFSDKIVLDYLLNEKINVTRDLLSVFLGVDYITPYVVTLITMKNNEEEKSPLELITPGDVSKIIENLLSINHGECIGNLLNGLSADQFQQIYKDHELENPKDAIYQLVCEKINEVNIKSTYCLLENLDYVKGIFKACTNYPSNNKLINKALRETAFKFYCKEEYTKLRCINDLLEEDSSDSDVLQIRRYVALEKRKTGYLGEALQIFQTIQDKLEHEKCSLYLLVLSDIAVTKNYMDNFDEAYKYFKYLYVTLLQQLDIESDELSYELYCNVMKSKKYQKYIDLDSNKFNILKIQDSIAHQLFCITNAKNKHEKKDYQDYQDALNIYEAIFEIRRTHAVFSTDMPKSLCSLAHMHITLADIASDQKKLEHQYKTLEMYAMMLTVQNKLYWKTHPVVKKTWYDIINTVRGIAISNTNLGNLKISSAPAEAQQHYEKALRVFRQIFKIKKSDKDISSFIGSIYIKLGDLNLPTDHVKALGYYEEALKTYEGMYAPQEGNLCSSVVRFIAYTNNKLGNIKQFRNQSDALQHYEEALHLYKRIQTVLNDEVNKAQNLEPNIDDNARDIGYTNIKLGDLKILNNPKASIMHYEEVLNIYKEIKNKDKIIVNTIVTLNKKLGDLKKSTNPLVARRHWEEALQFIEYAQSFQQTSSGEVTLRTQFDKANLHESIGTIASRNDAIKHYAEAIKILENVYGIQKRTLGEQHSLTSKTAIRLMKIEDKLFKIQRREFR